MALFSARQPIFDSKKNVAAYELLYRSDTTQKAAYIVDGNQATASVLTQAMMVADYDTLSNNKKVFINFTKDLIMKEVAYIFDRSKFVIEILEDIDGDNEIIEKVKELKKRGYTIALDDMALNTNQDSLLEYVDIVKVDFLALNNDFERLQITSKLRKYKNIKLLAEKVETNEDFEFARRLGYTYFQGYFFQKPEIIKNDDIEVLQTTQISLIKELNTENVDIDKLVQITQTDISLSYKLLKLLSSAAYYRRSQITSVREAIVTLGITGFKKWIFLIMIQSLPQNKPTELINISLQRGKFLEKCAIKFDNNLKNVDSYFLVGLLSILDALMDRDLNSTLEELKIDLELKDAIISRKGRMGLFLDIVEALGKNESDIVEKKCIDNDLNIEDVYDIYIESMDVANMFLS